MLTAKTTIYALETLNLFIEKRKFDIFEIIGANYANCIAKSLTGRQGKLSRIESSEMCLKFE